MGFFEATWQSLMRSLDAGTVAGDVGWGMRLIGILITISGIFILSTLIGVLTSGLSDKIDELRKGRSKVLEEGHTLILGWSPKVFNIISELVIANENQKKPRIVIMADKDKVEMEDEIRSKVPDTKNTKVICRTGSPIDLTDLEIVSPNDAKSIIILSPDEENPDIYVVKSVMAITNNPNRKKDKYYIVAEITDEDNLEAAELVGTDEAVFLLSDDLIARVTAQTCRQSGLSVVYTELLDYGGCEIYIKEEPTLTGKTYKDALFAYDSSSIMGIMKKNEEVLINPPMNTTIEKGEQVIVIAEDDDTIVLSGLKDYNINSNLISNKSKTHNKPESNLILGWNEKALTIICELENYVQEGSAVIIMAEKEDVEKELKSISKTIQKQKIKFVEGDIAKRADLNALDIPSHNHIILLAYNDRPVQEADAKTLIALLHLRNISETSNANLSIVSEMHDIRNRQLAEITKADDFIISNNLISLMLSQLSENKNLHKVFTNLFSAEGSEIYLKPVTDYITVGEETNFYTLMEAASQKGDTAIGYRLLEFERDPAKAYGISINPVKSEKIRFTEKDKVIVLSEE
jgi:voltage-gated potassium channel Kch